MKLKLKVWRQANRTSKGRLVEYKLNDVETTMSFFEMLDYLNETLIQKDQEPIVYDHDCREGICGACSLTINGVPHGPGAKTTTCLLNMSKFKDGDTIFIEPFRARAFPVVKDLVVDRSAMDEIIAAGGFIDIPTGSAPEANGIPVGKPIAERAMDAAACIGCGACIAACKNASAMLFTGAKITQLALLPQGRAEANRRALAMVAKMDELGFGNCSNEAECEAVCPKGIKIENIAKMNREFLKAIV